MILHINCIKICKCIKLTQNLKCLICIIYSIILTRRNLQHILNVVADNCLEIATDKSGCCVLQQCVAHAKGEPQIRLLAEIVANALVLSEHPYG